MSEINSNSQLQLQTSMTPGPKKFRFQGVKMFLTIPGHHGEEYIEFIQKVLLGDKKKVMIEEYIIGRETGESGYQHTHVVLKFDQKLCFQDAHKFDYLTLHPSIESVRNWADAVHYAAKDGDYDSNIDVDALVPIQKKIDSVINAKTMREALKSAISMNEVMPIIRLYESRGVCLDCPFKPLENLKPWQAKLVEVLEADHSNRSIHWVVDSVGGSGKTSLQKHMMATCRQVLVIPGASTAQNINEAIRGFVEAHGDLHYLLINLARGIENYESIYMTLEQVKDQMIFCPKYKSTVLVLQSCPKVCVFSNIEPDTTKLTSDRWRIHGILNEELI